METTSLSGSPCRRYAPALIVLLCLAFLVTVAAGAAATVAGAGQETPAVLVQRTIAPATTTPQTATCQAPCSCMEPSRAATAWGAEGFIRCDANPCGYSYTAAGLPVEKYCIQQKTVTTVPGRVYVPRVTTPVTHVRPVSLTTAAYPSINKSLITADTDKDGKADMVDNCPGIANAGQEDFEKDGVGDDCDNCILAANPDQEDADGDRIGDTCDLCKNDKDPSVAGNLDDRDAPGYADADNDGLGDRCDPCPNSPDTDGNGDGCGPCDFGTFKITDAIPLQVIDDRGIPLVEGKGTVFKVIVRSTFTCEKQVKFRLTLPAGEWTTTGAKNGIFPAQPFPAYEGPVPIPANAQDFVVILPYIAPDKTNETADPLKNNNIGKIARQPISYSVGPGMSGTAKIIRPDFRVMPAPVKTAQGRANFQVEIDPLKEIAGYHAPSYAFHGWEYVVSTRPWKFLFVPEKFEGVASRPQKTDPGEKASLERVLAAFPIADDAISATVMPSIGLTPCENGTSMHVCTDDIDQLPWCVNKNPCTSSNPYNCQQICTCTLPDKGADFCPYSYDIDAVPGSAEQKSAARYQYLATTAKKWGYDIGIGVSIYGGQEDSTTRSMTINPDDRFWMMAHEFNHFAVPMGDVPGYMDNCTKNGTGFWVNYYTVMKDIPYFMDGPSGYNWMIGPSTKGLNAANQVCLNEISTAYGGYASLGGMDSDGYINLVKSPQFKIKDPEGLLVSGTVAKDGTASLSPFSYLPETELDVLPGSQGDYTFILSDSTGTVLGTSGFSLPFMALQPDNPLMQAQPLAKESDWFVKTIEWKPGTRRIELRDNAGTVLATRIVSPRSPTVTITPPNGGESWIPGENVTLRWQGTDPDGDTLTYDIGISGDGGKSWVPLAGNLAGTSYTFRPGGLAVGDKYRVKVIASDGVNTGSAVSAADFRVSEPGREGTLPVVWITGLVLILIILAGAGWYLMRKKTA